MDYGFTHQGRTFTPNGTQGITPSDSDARNKALETAELDTWRTAPITAIGYYDLVSRKVTTWLGTKIGDVIESRVYRHNFGGQFISLRVRGTNGAEYYGRASYDWGSVITLRKVK